MRYAFNYMTIQKIKIQEIIEMRETIFKLLKSNYRYKPQIMEKHHEIIQTNNRHMGATVPLKRLGFEFH